MGVVVRSADHWHVPALDGLRGIAVLVVLLCHAPAFRLAGGNLGVDLFFVLSGFLITSILLNEWRQRDAISIPKFYLRRALRLFPAAFSVLLFALVFARFIQPAEQLQWWDIDALAVITYVFNWRLAWLYSGATGHFHNHMLSHFWSLSVEEQFYLIWPGLLLMLLRLKASRRLMVTLFAAGIAVPLIARILLWHGGPSLDLYFRSDVRVDALVWGAAFAWLMHNKMMEMSPRSRQFAGLIGFSALFGFLYISRFDLLSDGGFYRWGLSAAGLLSTIMIWSATSASTSIFSKCLSLQWLRWTGRISYGLYLWHIPVFTLCHQLQLTPNEEAPIAGLLTFVIAAISYRFYETPFLRLKEKLGYAQAETSRRTNVLLSAETDQVHAGRIRG
jgi:peptidoglycan/LPS O-acetylase OafA/YrhL